MRALGLERDLELDLDFDDVRRFEPLVDPLRLDELAFEDLFEPPRGRLVVAFEDFLEPPLERLAVDPERDFLLAIFSFVVGAGASRRSRARARGAPRS